MLDKKRRREVNPQEPKEEEKDTIEGKKQKRPKKDKTDKKEKRHTKEKRDKKDTKEKRKEKCDNGAPQETLGRPRRIVATQRASDLARPTKFTGRTPMTMLRFINGRDGYKMLEKKAAPASLTSVQSWVPRALGALHRRVAAWASQAFGLTPPSTSGGSRGGM